MLFQHISYADKTGGDPAIVIGLQRTYMRKIKHGIDVQVSKTLNADGGNYDFGVMMFNDADETDVLPYIPYTGIIAYMNGHRTE